MPIKNYTSEVPAVRSIDNIKKILLRLKAKSINEEYEHGKIVGLKFLVDVNDNSVAFDIPAKVNEVFDLLWKEVKQPISGTKDRVRAQAERTAWKLVYDWVEVQAAMIEMQQADLVEVFLPYALVGGTTLYKSIKQGGMKMLTGG